LWRSPFYILERLELNGPVGMWGDGVGLDVRNAPWILYLRSFKPISMHFMILSLKILTKFKTIQLIEIEKR
jgi:hypothetical protein